MSVDSQTDWVRKPTGDETVTPHGGVSPAAVLIAAAMALALLSACTAASEPTTTTWVRPTRQGTAATVEEDGPPVAPIDACSLLSEFEVYEALGVGYVDGAVMTETGIGHSRKGAGGTQVEEGCEWSFFPTSSEFTDFDDQFTVAVTPGDPADFEPGHMMDLESGEAAGVPVTGVGDVALWFSGGDSGVMSVVQETPFGYLVLHLSVRHDDLEEAKRRQAAVDLAAKVADRLASGPVEPVEWPLCDLLSDDYAEEVLAPYRDASPGASAMNTMGESAAYDLTVTGNSSCTKLILVDTYVRIGQGMLVGFTPGIEIGGVPGEPVDGVGDEAIWFPGVPDPSLGEGEKGLLNVRFGEAQFRVEVSLPGQTDEEQLNVAEELASQALNQLMGGGVTVTERAAPEAGPIDLVDNLLAKEESGEWTRGQGLIATLELFTGETEVADVVGPDQLVVLDELPPQLVLLAEDYVANGTDEPTRTDVQDLLARLLITRDQLEKISTPDESASGPRDLLVYAGGLMAQEEGGEDELQDAGNGQATDYCTEFFQTTEVCLVEKALGSNPEKYKLFYPKSEYRSGWTQDQINWTVEAMGASVEKFELLGTMPPTEVFLTQFPDWRTYTESGDTCLVDVPLGAYSNEGRFKQSIAAYLARCLLNWTFPIDSIDEALVGRWWFQATAIYLSGVVYPKVNAEQGAIPFLEDIELDAGLLSRQATNWIFFENLDPEIHPAGIMSVLKALPGSLHTTFAEKWHPFNEKLTDVQIADIGGGGMIQVRPQIQPVEIHGQGEASFPVHAFGVNRLQVEVTGGPVACVDFHRLGSLTVSWREGTAGAPGPAWSTDLPKDLSGVSVFLLTATGTSTPRLTIEVKKLVDNPDDCEEDDEQPTSNPYPPPPPPTCPCLSTSNYFRYLEQLGSWLGDALGN